MFAESGPHKLLPLYCGHIFVIPSLLEPPLVGKLWLDFPARSLCVTENKGKLEWLFGP